MSVILRWHVLPTSPPPWTPGSPKVPPSKAQSSTHRKREITIKYVLSARRLLNNGTVRYLGAGAMMSVGAGDLAGVC